MNVRYTRELLEEAIQTSKSWSEVCRKFRIKPSTGSQTHIKNRAKHFEINSSHFTGRKWRKGKKFQQETRSLQDYLSNDHAIISSRLRKKLISCNLKEKKCEMCGLSTWMKKEIPLELDHVDGNPNNNHLENLMIVCPNCHSLKHKKSA